MKILLKKIPALIILLCLAGIANSQLKGFSLGPFIEAGWPTGEFQQTHNNGIGGGFGADIRLPGKFGLTGSVGYIYFAGKSSPVSGEGKYASEHVVPLRLGLKYRALPLVYFTLESGVARRSDDKVNATIFSPGVGIRVLGLDLRGKYETWIAEESRSFWGLKLGYNF